MASPNKAAAPDDPRNLQNPGRDTVSCARAAGERRNVRCVVTAGETKTLQLRVASTGPRGIVGHHPHGSTSFLLSVPRARNTQVGTQDPQSTESRNALHGREEPRPSESLSPSRVVLVGWHPSGSIMPDSTARSSNHARATQTRNTRHPKAQRRFHLASNRCRQRPKIVLPLGRT